MPKSKRDKKVSLTKVTKKVGLQLKQKVIEDIQKYVEDYNSVFVVSWDKMRNEKQKELRVQWKPSRFVFGKNSLLQLAMGKTSESEPLEGLHKLSQHIRGQCGLLFTDKVEAEVLEWFKNYSRQDFARSGTIAEDTLVLNEGPLTQFPGSLEPRLRQLGLPTQLKGGVVSLLQDVIVCTEGKVIMPEQARILRLLGRETSRFTLSVRCRWGKDGNFKIYKEADKDMETENIQEK
uniref:Ribosome assembly factor mrt4 n=1 Tax=Timema shepardi TaxID=629360 RepID=A0A7R9G0P0_TIMSH|nr:unnamed protein product [Timema shepardi]